MKKYFIIFPAIALLLFNAINVALSFNSKDQDSSKHWIYSKHYEIYSYLLGAKNTRLSKDEKHYIATQAYSCFFEYWILHHSKFKALDPDYEYQRSFSRLLTKRVLESVDAEDPLLIKQFYVDGRFNPSQSKPPISVPEFALYPRVEGLPYSNLKKWDDYQTLVISYRRFIAKTTY